MSAKAFTIGGHTISYGGFLLRELGGGTLTISKTVTGTGFDPTKTFELTVTFDKAVTYNGTTSTTHTINLASGQSATITDIPENTHYAVVETPLSPADIAAGYRIAGASRGEGLIPDGQVEAIAINAFAVGSLQINMSVGGSGYSPTKMAYTVTFDHAVQYSVNGTLIATPSATFSGTAADGTPVILGNLPENISYTIAETPFSTGDSLDGYSNGEVTGGSGTLAYGDVAVATLRYSYSDPGTSLPIRTLQFEFGNADYDPSVSFIGSGYTWVRKASSPNVWNCTVSGTNWREKFEALDRTDHFYGQDTGDIIVRCGNLATVTNIGWLFCSLKKLKKVRGLRRTSQLTYMAAAFAHTGLNEIELFDTSAVTIMFNAFENTNIRSIPLFNTANVTDISGIFSQCANLTSVPQFNTSKMTSMSFMFYECTSLQTVPFFNTSNVTYMVAMFEGCTALKSIPLYNTVKVENANFMCSRCTHLTTVPAFNLASMRNVNYMFQSCYRVTGGALALYQRMAHSDIISHTGTFRNCGANTDTGAAELAQIPSAWK